MLLIGDVREKIKEIKDESVQAIVTSPPYWGLRDYDESNQIGQEKIPEEFIYNILQLSWDLKRILKDDGIFWLNLGDTYYGPKGGHWSSDNSFTNDETGTKYREQRKAPPKHSYLKTKDLVGVPWKTAIALQQNGWYIRNDIIWSKNNPMPEAVKDRFAKSHEHIFMLTKKPNYYFDYEAVLEPYTKPLNRWGGDNYNDVEVSKYENNPNGKTRKDVWKLNTSSYKGGHFAVFPEDIPELCIKASTKKGDTVLDPFMGSGTTAVVAKKLERKWIGIELNPEYAQIINDRTCQTELF